MLDNQYNMVYGSAGAQKHLKGAEFYIEVLTSSNTASSVTFNFTQSDSTGCSLNNVFYISFLAIDSSLSTSFIIGNQLQLNSNASTNNK